MTVNFSLSVCGVFIKNYYTFAVTFKDGEFLDVPRRWAKRRRGQRGVCVSNRQIDDVCFCGIVLGASVSLLSSLLSSFLLSLDSFVMKL